MTKFYQRYSETEQQSMIEEIFSLVSRREDGVCSFLEGGQLVDGSDYRLIYRHYATLYFIFCVDSSESELGILDLIQVLVETLDRCFENVCELDLIFHVDKVHFILNEMIMGGMVLETSLQEIVSRFHEQQKIAKSETPITHLIAHKENNSQLLKLISSRFYRHLWSLRQIDYHRAFKE